MTELNLTNLSNHDTMITSTTTQETTMTLQPSSHHVNTTLNTGSNMSTYGQTLIRFQQLLHTHQMAFPTIQARLNELAMQYYYNPSDDNKERFAQYSRYYDELFEKYDCINTAYRQFLKDGKAPEWL